jgi:hypothetical protein
MLAGVVKLFAVAVALAAGRAGADCDSPGPVRVTVVVVLASADDPTVDPKLVALAREVRKRNPALTGFRVAVTLQHSIPVGTSHTFDLPDKQKLKVTIEKPRDTNDRVGLTIRPPGLGEITYTCVCQKFFPVVTPHVTKAGERLIVAVMAKPCAGK